MRFSRTNGIADSYHNLIAHLMRGHRVRVIRDRRPKTVELAHAFDVRNWDEARILRKCFEYREAAWAYLRKVTESPKELLVDDCIDES